MTLLQTRYFAAVAETGNISRAAKNLSVSRPTISRALHELEDEFGMPFFNRTDSGLLLTEEGRFFYEKCVEILHRSEVLEAQMHSLYEKMMPTASRTVKLCITPATSITLFPRLCRELQAEYPDINLVTMEYGQRQARATLEDGTLDFHLASDVHWGCLQQSFRYLELGTNDIVFCVSSKHRLANRTSVTIEDIKDEPLACFDQYYFYESYTEKRFAEKGMVANIVFRSFQLSAIREMVASGLACTAMMRGSIDDGKTIVGLPFEPVNKWTTALVWNTAVPRNSACKDFLKFAQGFRERIDAEKTACTY